MGAVSMNGLPEGFQVESMGGLPDGFQIEHIPDQNSYTASQVPIAAASNLLPDLQAVATDTYKGIRDNPLEFIKSALGFPIGMIERAASPAGGEIAQQYFDPVVRNTAHTLGFTRAPDNQGNLGPINFNPETLKTNIAEHPAQTALSVAPFIPDAGILNPVRPAAKAITGVLKQAGKVTDAAREVPVVGPAAEAATQALNPRLAAVRDLPTYQDFRDQANNAYTQAEAKGVNYTPSWYQRLVSGLQADMTKNGFNDRFHPSAAGFLSELKSRLPQTQANPTAAMTGLPATTTGPAGNLSLRSLEQFRSELGAKARDLRKANNSTDAAQLELMQKYLDKFTEAPVRKSDITGNAQPQEAYDLMRQGRAAYKQAIKMQKLDELEYQANLDVGTKYTQAGYEQALRKRFKDLIKDPNERRLWSPEEQRAILAVPNEGKLARGIGQLAPSGALSKQLLAGYAGTGAAVGVGAAHLGGAVGVGALAGPAAIAAIPAMAAPVAGVIGKKIATARTLGAAQNVRGVVAGGRLGPLEHPATPAVAQGLATGTLARNQDRKSSLDFAENVIGTPMMNHIKQTPSLRPLLNDWLSARASRKGDTGEGQALANAIAAEVNRPDLAPRIAQELGQ